MSNDLHEKLDKMSEKLDKMNDTMVVIQISQGKTEVNIAEHMRRTSAAEENLEIIHQELAPIKVHVAQVSAVIKFCMWAFGGIITISAALFAYFKKA